MNGAGIATAGHAVVDTDDVVWRPLMEADLLEVVAIEALSHTAPWSRGNFIDAMLAGYAAMVGSVGRDVLVYGVWMLGPGEAQLLNLTVRTDARRRGLARTLMKRFAAAAAAAGAEQAFLEVRVSNTSAISLYASEGYAPVGRRANYYPASTAAGSREDALVLRRRL